MRGLKAGDLVYITLWYPGAFTYLLPTIRDLSIGDHPKFKKEHVGLIVDEPKKYSKNTWYRILAPEGIGWVPHFEIASVE